MFEPINIASVVDHAAFVPGFLETLAYCRTRRLKIGSTTGYTRPIMAALEPIAKRGGYEPDIIVCAGDLPAGRPSPLMMWRAMSELGVWPAHTVVKVDDTAPGIGEGIAAGTWTVGVTLSGNEVGLTPSELARASKDELSATSRARRRRLERRRRAYRHRHHRRPAGGAERHRRAPGARRNAVTRRALR